MQNGVLRTGSDTGPDSCTYDATKVNTLSAVWNQKCTHAAAKIRICMLTPFIADSKAEKVSTFVMTAL